MKTEWNKFLTKQINKNELVLSIEELEEIIEQIEIQAIINERKRIIKIIGKNDKIIKIDNFLEEFDIATNNCVNTGKNELRKELIEKLTKENL